MFFVLFCGLLIGTVIFLVFFPHQSRTLFKPILPFPATLHENTSHHHVLVAGDIIESMDASVDPCDDFYSFSCNGWINKHPLPRVVINLFVPFFNILLHQMYRVSHMDQVGWHFLESDIFSFIFMLETYVHFYVWYKFFKGSPSQCVKW